MNADLLLYGVHALAWGSFGVTGWILSARDDDGGAAGAGPAAAGKEETAPYSRSLLFFHMLAFGLMYFGIANAVLPNRVPAWFPGQRVAGTCVIAAGAALMSWARLAFRSWRFRAKLDKGHQLATGGPFRFLRHPIYMGLNLLALGSAIWVPTASLWIAFVLMVVGSDLRARVEERILAEAFGATYAAYCARTQRFVPGLY